MTALERGDLDVARFTLALEAGRAGTWQWDRRSGIVDWDAALEALYGLVPGTFGGGFTDWVACIHPDDRAAVLERLEETIASRSPHHLLYRAVRPDGTVRWIESRGRVLLDGAGSATGMVGVCYDVTDRQAIDAERVRLLDAERRARERLEFLAEASDLLTRSLDMEVLLQQLADLVVPRLGTWCTIQLLQQGALRPVARVHPKTADPALVDLMTGERIRASAWGATTALQTGEVQVTPAVTDDVLRTVARDEAELGLLRALGATSVVLVPLRTRAQNLGVLSLVHAESGRQHTAEDIGIARELGTRAAIAIENARLFAERSRVAAMLQRALLPPALPDIPGVELGTCLHTAEGIDIGGDFYDVMGGGTSWTLLLGDVRGKGAEAASLTALARHTARAAALHDPDPAHVLGVLNDALLDHDRSESFCTAVCAHLDLEQRVDLAVASGGHPPPLVLRDGGTVEPLPASGMLVGLFDDVGCVTVRTTLHPGDLLVFYTDGVLEARRGDELFGGRRLEATVAETAGLGAQDALDHIYQTVSAFQTEQRDDAAMLALRVRP